ncbi:hypothetical protein HY065_03080 [Candidatus Berkelbacteria bacterium]|nr:hypothetical protein [Candidatus Berkelbacteria bacterium]
MARIVKPVKATQLERPGKILFVVPEAPLSQKNIAWFMATTAVFVITVALFVWFKLYLLSIAVVLGTSLFYLFSVRETQKQLCAMGDRGVTFRGWRYPFAYFRHFAMWQDRFGDGGVITLTPSVPFKPPLTLRFEGVHHAPIRLFLRHHLPEQFYTGAILGDLVARLTRI